MSKDKKTEEAKVLTEEEKKEKKLAVSGLAPTSAGIDIFNIEPTKISRDLRGKFLCLYGDEKVGKTTFGIRAPGALLLAFEKGYNALGSIKPVDLTTWAEMKKVVNQLDTPRAKEMYQTVVIDTIGVAAELCTQFVAAQHGVSFIGDVPYGAGWGKAAEEMSKTLRKIAMMGYGVVILAHSKDRPETIGKTDDNEGTTIIHKEPDIGTKRMAAAINRFVDVTGYIALEFGAGGEAIRTLYTRQTPTIKAGSRFPHLPAKIPFGYVRLIEALSDAIEQSAELDGASLTDIPDKPIERKNRPFEETMKEGAELWATLKLFNEANIPLMLKIIKDVFGNQTRLSEATPDQQDLVELVLDKFRDMLQKQ